MNNIIIIIGFITIILLTISLICTMTKHVENFELNDTLSQTIKQINQDIEKETYLSKTNDSMTYQPDISKSEEIPDEENSIKDDISIKNTNKTTMYSKKVYIQPDMSKFILKSEVPSCPKVPNMSKYMLKTELPNQPNLSKFILKSNVPSCPKIPNMNNYILKNNLPSCPKPMDMSKYVLKSSVPAPIDCPCLPVDTKIPKGCPKPEKICPKEFDHSKYILKSSIPKCSSKNIKKTIPDINKLISKNNISNRINNTVNNVNNINRQNTTNNRTNNNTNNNNTTNNRTNNNTNNNNTTNNRTNNNTNNNNTTNTNNRTNNMTNNTNAISSRINNFIKNKNSSNRVDSSFLPKKLTNKIEKDLQNNKYLSDNSINRQTRLNKKPTRQCSDPNKCLLPLKKNIYSNVKKTPKKCSLFTKIIKKADVYGAY